MKVRTETFGRSIAITVHIHKLRLSAPNPSSNSTVELELLLETEAKCTVSKKQCTMNMSKHNLCHPKTCELRKL